MENVKVWKTDLKRILRENRAEHRTIFEKAQKAYRKKVVEVLDAQLKAAREDKQIELSTITRLVTPVNHEHDYDVALKMVDMEVENTISLDQEAFRQYVLDEWNWTRQWALSNSNYTSSSKFDPYVQ